MTSDFARPAGSRSARLGAAALAAALAAPAALAESDIPRRDTAETFGLCTSCHKADGRGGPGYGGYAANLRTTALTAGEIVEIISEGRQDRGMPTFKAILEPAEIADLATFILVELRDETPEGEAAQPE